VKAEARDLTESGLLLERALPIGQQSLGPCHQEIPGLLDDFASITAYEGDYGEAQKLYATALAANELIAAIEFPIAKAGERCVILELARRSGDYAMAGIVAKAKLAGSTLVEPSLVFFGVGDRPVSAERATGAVAGRIATAETIAAAQAALDADLDPPADLHGSPQMKRHLARVLLARALKRLTGTEEARAA